MKENKTELTAPTGPEHDLVSTGVSSILAADEVPDSRLHRDLEPYFTEHESQLLKNLIQSGYTEGDKELLEAVFGRLFRVLEQKFGKVNLDLAFTLLEPESDSCKPLVSAVWTGDELSAMGEAFFSWAENRAFPLAGSIPVEDWAVCLGDIDFWKFLALESGVPTPAVEQESCKEGVEEQTLHESEPILEGPADGPELDESRLFEVGPANVEEESSEKAVDVTEAETLALGALARQAVARAEAKAARMERIQAILKTSLESLPLLPQESTPIVEIEAQDSPTKEATPERRTVLFSSSRSRQATSEEHDDGEELSFSQAPSSPFEKKNQLVVKNKFLGYGKNSDGVIGLCGQLKISMFFQEEMAGRLESSNPLLFLSPAQLTGTSTTVTYWMPPVAFPHPAGQLLIRSKHDSKTLAIHSLFPKSRTDYLRGRHVLAALFAPSLLGFFYFFLVYFFTVRGIDFEAQELFPELYEAALEGIKGVDFRSGGLGLFRLKVVPAAESLQMIWAAVILLGPLLSSKFFHYLSRSRKRRLGGPLAGALLTPSLLLLAAWNFQDYVLPLHDHRDFAPLAVFGLLKWSLPLNTLIAGYLFLSNFGYWDRWIRPREARIAMPYLLTILYIAIMFGLIYGRSWLS